MCGIIAVLRRRTVERPVSVRQVLTDLEQAGSAFPDALGDEHHALAGFDGLAQMLESINRELSSVDGLVALVRDEGFAGQVEQGLAELERRVVGVEDSLDSGEHALSSESIEAFNARLLRVRDVLWAVLRDRLGCARAVRDLAGAESSRAAVSAYGSIQVALSALDRLEVRGRDSAGIEVLVSGHGLDLAGPELSRALVERGSELFTDGTLRVADGQLCFVYKAAAEIGELGDNGRKLRQAIRDDQLLRRAVSGDDAEVLILGHTRWASVGIISQANAHPLDQREADRGDGPFVTAVLNGDVDNHLDLSQHEGLRVQPEITTDAKIIPVLVSRAAGEGVGIEEAFRRTVRAFEGSVAIAASSGALPDRLLLALHGSGQALYVGVNEDTYIVASEPYGVVEITDTYLRMDGETPGNPENVSSSRGQVVVLDRNQAGNAEAIRRMAYDGTELPVQASELIHAEITTRDIDRGEHRHFLAKEIAEAPLSWRKTLRGKIHDDNGRLVVRLGPATLPDLVRNRLAAGQIKRVEVIGQGTAAVAGQGVAAAMARILAGSHVSVRSLPATEMSGFEMHDDMSDTLVVAISQSGTTTDTNRTVDLLRRRGACVIAIVNRRGSDLTSKSDGVLYTSDGRDVEMSVASTKAFYAQIAAGVLLSAAVARELGCADDAREDELLRALRELPEAMGEVLGQSERIAEVARRHAPRRRYWAVVGNGFDKVAAEEIRIKLSELCYKSIACDVTEDKKHIDLSSEPLILVCASGVSGSTADDVAKEVAIYRAHKALPIVVATEGSHRFPSAVELIAVPAVHQNLGFVLSTMVGHLFGYHAAMAIDALAHPLRECRADIERLAATAGPSDDLLAKLAGSTAAASGRFFDLLGTGEYDGHMEASTAVRVASMLRYVRGTVPLDSYQADHGKIGTPGVVIEDLTGALTKAIEELTRPIDAIKHQAKTVTVGISRSDDALLDVPLIQEVLAAGAPRDRLRYSVLRTLASLDTAIESVNGYTRYRLTGSIADNTAQLSIVGKGGIAAAMESRIASDPTLRGTKHLVARERKIMVARGRSDGRTVVIVPEVEAGVPTGITLLHVTCHDHISPAAMRGVLGGYRNRYPALVDAVTETEPTLREELFETMSVIDLLTLPIHVLAERWRCCP